MKFLKEAGLRPYTPQEILSLLINDEDLKNSLKSKMFYLAGSGRDTGMQELGVPQGFGGRVYTVDENGELAEIKVSGLSQEKKVYFWPGNGPLFLCVFSDGAVNIIGARFELSASDPPCSSA